MIQRVCFLPTFCTGQVPPEAVDAEAVQGAVVLAAWHVDRQGLVNKEYSMVVSQWYFSGNSMVIQW